MKNKKTYIIIAGALIVLILVAVFKSRSGGDSTKVTVERAILRTIMEMVSASGRVQPEVEVKISPDVSGEVVELFVKEGDQVKKGDVLARINPDIYISTMERMEATLQSSQASLANSKARLSQAKANMIQAENSFKRNEKLWKEGAVSQAEYEQAKSAYDVAMAENEAAEQNVSGSGFSVKSTEASLREAEKSLKKTTIVSPMDGTVSILKVEKGERVVGTTQMAGTEMMRVARLETMEVNVDVNENDIVRVSYGDTAEIEVDAFLGRKFLGTVTEIANSANVKGENVDQVTTFNVKVRILQSSYNDLIDKSRPHLSPFRPGMSATVDVFTAAAENSISVPVQSVTTREDTVKSEEPQDENVMRVQDNQPQRKKKVQECVFLIKEGKAEKRNVLTGIQDSKHIQILSGLLEGDEIISGPYAAVSRELSDGAEVEKTEKSELYEAYKKKK